MRYPATWACPFWASNFALQPSQQKYSVLPAWVSDGVVDRIATVILHTASIASSGALPAAARTGCSCCAWSAAAGRRRAGADVQAGRDVDPRQKLVRHAVAPKLDEDAVTALAARHQADIGKPCLEADTEAVQLVPAVRGDDQRQGAGARHQVGALHPHHREAELRADTQDSGGDRR